MNKAAAASYGLHSRGCTPDGRASSGPAKRRAAKIDLNITKEAFRYSCDVYGIPEPVFEYRFHQVRKWRFDYAWPTVKLAVERQGGLFSHGAHARGGYIRKEHAKRNEAAILGWRILYFLPEEFNSGAAFEVIRRALAGL